MSRRRNRARSNINRLLQDSTTAGHEDQDLFEDPRDEDQESRHFMDAGWFVEEQMMSATRNDFVEWP